MSNGITHEHLMAALGAKFPAEQIEWRVGMSGTGGKGPWAKALAYLTSRAVMDRLDSVVGPQNWTDKYEMVDGGILCTLSIKINGEWVSKTDGAQVTAVEPFKGGLSDAFKRVAVKWGIGRYLYDLEETFVKCSKDKQQGWKYAQDKKSKTTFYWEVPTLPSWALPAGQSSSPATTKPTTEVATEVTQETNGSTQSGDATLSLDQYQEMIKGSLKARTDGFKDTAELARLKKLMGINKQQDIKTIKQAQECLRAIAV